MQITNEIMEAVGVSDLGRVRSENQDSIFLDPAGSFLLVADGMGGHERGLEASSRAVDIIQSHLQPDVINSELCDITEGSGIPAEVVCLTSLIDEAVRSANETLFSINQAEKLSRYMGTTVVGLIFAGREYILWFHIGDSRLYRWREGELTQLTTDHSARKEWERKGRQGDAPNKNIITRAIGPTAGVSAETAWEAFRTDDVYILCSDGLSDMVPKKEMARILEEEKQMTALANRLVDTANDAGGKDNSSVVVCRILSDSHGAGNSR
ncbi:MAG: protein phosphatase 2C domain-containing protein [Desulfobacterales bacterium]